MQDNRRDQHRNAEDEEHVGDVATVGIAERQRRHAARSRQRRDQHFRCTRAKTHDNEAHQQRRHLQACRQTDSTIHKDIGTLREQPHSKQHSHCGEPPLGPNGKCGK